MFALYISGIRTDESTSSPGHAGLLRHGGSGHGHPPAAPCAAGRRSAHSRRVVRHAEQPLRLQRQARALWLRRQRHLEGAPGRGPVQHGLSDTAGAQGHREAADRTCDAPAVSARRHPRHRVTARSVRRLEDVLPRHAVPDDNTCQPGLHRECVLPAEGHVRLQQHSRRRGGSGAHPHHADGALAAGRRAEPRPPGAARRGRRLPQHLRGAAPA